MSDPSEAMGTDSATTRALRFHLGELRSDLGVLTARLSAAAADTRAPGAAPRALSNALLKAVSALDHTLSYHVAQALALMGFSAPMTEEGREADPDANLETAVATLAKAVSQLRDLLEEPTATADLRHLGSALRAWRDELAAQLAILQRLYAEAEFRCLADPVIAAEEAADRERATALRELPHPLARTLAKCPFCGAPLDAGDRTFEGSYCETCRTRWIEGSEPLS